MAASDRDVVRAAFALDIELLNVECLRVADAGRRKNRCGHHGEGNQ